MSLDFDKEINKLEKYLTKEGQKDFVDEIRAASTETLDQKLLSLAKFAEEIKNTRNSDPDLKAAKAAAKEFGAPYREQLKMNSKLSRFVALLMQEKGMISEGIKVNSAE